MHLHKNLKRTTDHYGSLIYRNELKHRIRPHTKQAHFHLAPTVESWIHGASFDKILRLTSADEGELVRHFRMIIQLLREISHAASVSDQLRKTCDKAIKLLNRDVVDAERQLRA